ncbi:MAG: 4Fe-4S dicluster domain-containing protein [Candidatus Acidiferrum sp.]
MTPKAPQCNEHIILASGQFDLLLQALKNLGFEVLGPTLREGAIVYAPVASRKDLPEGWTDEQEGGKYRLKRREDSALFGYSVGPATWKNFLFPPVSRLWKAERRNGHFQIVPEEHKPPKYAFVGVRACDIQAMAIQDRVFLKGPYVDAAYQLRRANVFIVAVNCTQAGGTCFCTSMSSGPKATAGYDLALTEVLKNGDHLFVVHVGTEEGANLLSRIPHEVASDAEVAFAESIVAETSQQMGRTLNVNGIKELFYRNSESPRWDALANRCLSCANCTLVCPTCFCSTVEDVTDLTGLHAERTRKWDSCFTTDFSYIHGSSVRATPRSKYRQWITHKLAYWQDQFGSSGCVGCGRCITWCPVGIDITEEARALRESEFPTRMRGEEIQA